MHFRRSRAPPTVTHRVQRDVRQMQVADARPGEAAPTTGLAFEFPTIRWSSGKEQRQDDGQAAVQQSEDAVWLKDLEVRRLAFFAREQPGGSWGMSH